jgi:protein TonB
MTLGMLVAAGLFSLLASLIGGPLDVGKPIPTIPISFTRAFVPTPVEPPVIRERPDPPTTTTGPTGPRISDPEVVGPERGERITQPTFGTVIPPPETPGVGIDHDPAPVVRVNPDYPVRAIRGQIEGWVEVQFSVTATGAVRDVLIVDSHPKDIFDAAVIKAVGRWRYSPKVDNGVAVERIGMRTRILFELDGAQVR